MDLSEDRYDHEKPNLAWLCGIAEGRGLELIGPSLDSILSYRPDNRGGANGDLCYPVRYGYWVDARGAS